MGAGAEMLPAGFWDRPEVANTLDQRDAATFLVLVMKAGELSQHKLASATGLSQTQICQYVNKKHRPTLDNLRRISDALGMPAQARRRLGLAAAVGVGADDRGSWRAEMRLDRVLALAEHIGRTGDTSLLGTWRDLTLLGSTIETWDHLASVIAAPRPPAVSAADRMAARTRGFYLVSARLPARLVVRALTRHAGDITLLLEDAPADRGQRRDLTMTGGETSYLAACCNVDLGDLPGVVRQLDTIETAAREGDDRALAAMAMDGRSHMHASRGEHGRALELVKRAHAACPPEASQGTVTYLWLRIAEEHVYLRQVREAASAWRHAEERYPTVDIAADRNWIGLWLGPDCFESVRAFICAATGRAREAAEAAEHVAARLAAADGKADAIALVNAACAQALCGLFREAANTGRAALRALRAAEAAGSLPRLGNVAAILEPRAEQIPQLRAFLTDYAQTRPQLSAARLADR